MDIELELSTIYDHYKESVSYIKSDLLKRNKLSLRLLIIFVIYFLLEFEQEKVIETTNTFITEKFSVALNINYYVFFVALSILILFMLVSYFRLCISIERQYNYVHTIENNINTVCGKGLITREGHSYLAEYPLLLALIDRLYKLFLPFTVIILLSIKAFVLLKDNSMPSAYLIISTICSLLTIISVFLYILYLYREAKFINWLNNVLKTILKKIRLYKEE